MLGNELIRALQARFGGIYVPSARTILLRVTKLEDEWLLTKSFDRRKTVPATHRPALPRGARGPWRGRCLDPARTARAGAADSARQLRRSAPLPAPSPSRYCDHLTVDTQRWSEIREMVRGKREVVRGNSRGEQVCRDYPPLQRLISTSPRFRCSVAPRD